MDKFKVARSVSEFVTNKLSGRRVVFHHVPKCGGTSVYRALRLRYALSYEYIDLRALNDALKVKMRYSGEDERLAFSLECREVALLYSLYRDNFCIAGHIPFSLTAFEQFSPTYSFITILREPVEFFGSFYFYNTDSDVAEWRIDSSLEEFIDSPRARSVGNFYSRFFCGIPNHIDVSSADAVQRAKENLSKLTVVGLTDEMRQFEKRLREALGVTLKIGHENRARVPSAERQQLADPAIRKKIEAISGPNLEIYEYARTRLVG